MNLRFLSIALLSISTLPLAVHSADKVNAQKMVRFKPGTVGCMTEGGLWEIMRLANQNNKAGPEAMQMNKDGSGGECFVLSSDKTFEVLSANLRGAEFDL